jgi:hypothetical protein
MKKSFGKSRGWYHSKENTHPQTSAVHPISLLAAKINL